ncbi:cytosine deaminase [Cellulomonas bogoriensis 69B4 = DSM 16987]|uniref:Cytosine deaminase n=1 Tax=Cellulomonas bogoriensis 69B4 = DSM 16987 TaxID=1386082 RepID=A0A0A0BZD1_9CELL|nr:cytosine deaminase [Cellulomonas bogoriensis 69B4 = DSM 16987]
MTVLDATVIPVSSDPTAPQWWRGWMTVGHDGRITAMGEGHPPRVEGDVLDVGGAFVAPGFVSAHSHLYTSGMRGVAHSESLYPWVRANNEILVRAEARDMYWATVHGSLDFLGNGITSAFNFTQSRVIVMFDGQTGTGTAARVHDPGFVHAQVEGAADAGLRVVHAFRLDDDWFDEDVATGTFAQMVHGAAERTPGPQHLGSAVMGSVQWAASARTAELEVRAMREHGVLNQAHFVETAEGIELQRTKFDWYDRAGALGPGFWFGHFVHPTGPMVDRVAQTGAGVVWQATSNGRLGSGLADVIGYRKAGIPVAMGLDDQSCTDVSDPFQNMRMGLYAVRAAHRDAGVMTPADVLRLHTLESAAAIGAADRVGSLEVGKLADFVVVDPRRPDTGPRHDVVATYVLACSLRNLKSVHVGGRQVADADGPRGDLAVRASHELHTSAVWNPVAAMV